MDIVPIYVTYEEAQRLVPFFQHQAKHGPYREARESSQRILQELSYVKNRDYSPLSGKQVILTREDDRNFLMDTIGALEVR